MHALHVHVEHLCEDLLVCVALCTRVESCEVKYLAGRDFLYQDSEGQLILDVATTVLVSRMLKSRVTIPSDSDYKMSISQKVAA